VRFDVLTYHKATLHNGCVQLHPLDSEAQSEGASEEGRTVDPFQPCAIVNATGAWVDRTLQSLHVRSSRLIGGTRGSHLITSHHRLREALRGNGIYVEGSDGRPVFFLPLGETTLVGTTDVPFEGDPQTAVATDDEINYLLGAVRHVFPHVELHRRDIDLTYAGVRPLPAVSARSPSAVSRRHCIYEHGQGPVPIYSLVGGKLTTCRAVAEELALRILRERGQPVRANSRERALPGGEDYPVDESALNESRRQLALRWNCTMQQVSAVWTLCGTRADRIFAQVATSPDTPHTAPDRSIPDTDLPCAIVRWIIRNQWVTTVSDLVERRLMMVFHPQLSIRSLRALANLMVAERRLTQDAMDEHVERCAQRLRSHFGRSL
jgi:glycerol-3-phosphate dehydrogenase